MSQTPETDKSRVRMSPYEGVVRARDMESVERELHDTKAKLARLTAAARAVAGRALAQSEFCDAATLRDLQEALVNHAATEPQPLVGLLLQESISGAPYGKAAIVIVNNVEWTSRAPRNATEAKHINQEARRLIAPTGL